MHNTGRLTLRSSSFIQPCCQLPKPRVRYPRDIKRRLPLPQNKRATPPRTREEACPHTRRADEPDGISVTHTNSTSSRSTRTPELRTGLKKSTALIGFMFFPALAAVKVCLRMRVASCHLSHGSALRQ